MDSPWPKPPGGGQSILLSPFSRLAISCPAPAPGKLHLLLLNHFLFTACLLQPLSSGNTQQPSKSSRMDAWTEEDQTTALREGHLVLPSRHLINTRAGEHEPWRRERTLPGPRLTHGSVSHPSLESVSSSGSLPFPGSPKPLSWSPLLRPILFWQTRESLWSFSLRKFLYDDDFLQEKSLGVSQLPIWGARTWSQS